MQNDFTTQGQPVNSNRQEEKQLEAVQRMLAEEHAEAARREFVDLMISGYDAAEAREKIKLRAARRRASLAEFVAQPAPSADYLQSLGLTHADYSAMVEQAREELAELGDTATMPEQSEGNDNE